MTTAAPKNANVQLLARIVYEEDRYDNNYRFAVDGQHVKYISTAPGTFRGAEDDGTFEPLLLSELLPPFPAGDWNSAYVAKSPDTGSAAFLRTETVRQPGVRNLWHPVRLSELDFTRKDDIRHRVHVSTHPELNGGKPVLVKLAVWPWEIPSMEAETTAYQWLSGTGIGPRFLGHLTEGKGGRVVGFVAEWLDGARAAGPEDLDGCRKALGRLHELGIKMGDVNRYNFLVREGHDVVAVDFETARRGCSAEELEVEMSELERCLGTRSTGAALNECLRDR